VKTSPSMKRHSGSEVLSITNLKQDTSLFLVQTGIRSSKLSLAVTTLQFEQLRDDFWLIIQGLVKPRSQETQGTFLQTSSSIPEKRMLDSGLVIHESTHPMYQSYRNVE